ncbi:hypothetical protein [Streptomyces sp. XH2]|uniref:hypothetical protein n=1 Tax=Streptomyces sp. XH2 TaxID=3412483 RepID=UPI003C7C2779
MQVKYAMSPWPADVSPEAAVEETARRRTGAGVAPLLVVDGDDAIGMVTDRDLVVRAMARGFPSRLKAEGAGSVGPPVVEAARW